MLRGAHAKNHTSLRFDLLKLKNRARQRKKNAPSFASCFNVFGASVIFLSIFENSQFSVHARGLESARMGQAVKINILKIKAILTFSDNNSLNQDFQD